MREIYKKVEEILFPERILKKTPITKGWSNDQKVRLDSENSSYLLRMTTLDTWKRKEYEFQVMKKIHENYPVIPKPIAIGRIDEVVFQLFTYLEGDSLDEVIHEFNREKQLELGVAAGTFLKNLHRLNVEIPNKDYATLEQEKIMKRLKTYQESIYKTDKDDQVIDFIKHRLKDIRDYTPVLTHGDFHLGNMIVHQGNLAIIDFNRMDIEDPYREFVSMLFFSEPKSTSFAMGQLQGYFQNHIPENFWNRLSIYMAYVSMHSLIWAEPYGEEEVKTLMAYKEYQFDQFEGFKRRIPKWYT